MKAGLDSIVGWAAHRGVAGQITCAGDTSLDICIWLLLSLFRVKVSKADGVEILFVSDNLLWNPENFEVTYSVK